MEDQNMESFAQKVIATPIPENGAGVFFLGQAGFVFKTPADRLIALDPYLSDCCHRHFGFKRLMPYILEPKELTFDILLVSHGHYDHFDPDSVPALMENGHTRLIGAKDVKAECDALGLSENLTFISVGDTVTDGDFTVTAVPCDHGELAPDALGLLIEIGGKRIYSMGDTCYRPDLLTDPALQGLDLLILPINGAFGNLNEEQAAQVIATLKPKMAVPCHFWNFAEHGGNPGVFQEKMKELAPDCAYVFMRQGEGMIV
jgi:L-ascorbate 6-phosphate lactonase